jgi:hypothetical protein
MERGKAFYRKCSFWERSSSGYLMTIRAKAKRIFWEIEKLQAKEYRELFPSTCSMVVSQDREQNTQQNIIPSLHREHGSQADAHPDITKRLPFQVEIVQGARSRQGNWRAPKVDPTQLSTRRGPPTDRSPDKPPPWKGAPRGCLQEMAGTRHASQLAFFTRGSYSLSGNATPLQTMQIQVCAPSNDSASHAAGGSSQIQVPVPAELEAREV